MKDVQLRMRDQPVHQAGVDQRDDRVVVARHDECRLAQQRQERHARPAGPGGELVEVATRRPDPGMRVHRGGDQPRIGPGGSAVQAGCGALQVAGVQVAPRRDHLHQHGRPGRHHERAGSGADQHQPPAPRPLEGREMLCDPAAPGDAEHVDRVISERGQHPGDQLAQPREAVRGGREGRAADAGNVETDHTQRRIKRVHERLQQVQAGADAVDQQQRHPVRLPPAHGDAQLLVADADAAHRLRTG